MVPALVNVWEYEPDDLRPESNDLSSAVTVCSRPLSSQFQIRASPGLAWTSFGLKAIPLIVTGPFPTAGSVVWVTLTSPPVSLLHPAPRNTGTTSTRARGRARGRTTSKCRGAVDIVAGAMVAGLAFLATAVATLFAEATFKRWRQRRRPHEGAWTVALALFALASAALATGASTGWDRGVFRVFYLLGAVLNVPWLALGTVYLLFGARAGRRVRAVLVFLSGLAAGVLLTAPMSGTVAGSATIPVGKEVFGVFPRVLAGVGSGLGAVVVFGGAVWSAVRFARAARGRAASPPPAGPAPGRMAAANALIALGTFVLSGGGTLH